MNTAASLVSRLEWERGYKGNDGEVMLIGLYDDPSTGGARSGLSATVDAYSDSYPMELVKTDILIEQHGHDGVIAVAWGGSEAVRRLEDWAQARSHENGSTPAVVTALCIEHDQVSQATNINQPGAQWDNVGPLPDISDEMIPRGYRPPVVSRTQRVESWSPVEEPLPSVDPRAQEMLDQIPPSHRAQIALDSLAELAENQAADGGVGDPGATQMVAAAVDSHTSVRDLVAVEASQDKARVAALITAYRHSPVEHREAMSGAAAAANFLSGGSSQATIKLAEPAVAAGEGPHYSIANVCSASAERGLPPQPLYERVSEAIPQNINAADQRFEQQRHAEIDAQNQAVALQQHALTPQPSTPMAGPGL